MPRARQRFRLGGPDGPRPRRREDRHDRGDLPRRGDRSARSGRSSRSAASRATRRWCRSRGAARRRRASRSRSRRTSSTTRPTIEHRRRAQRAAGQRAVPPLRHRDPGRVDGHAYGERRQRRVGATSTRRQLRRLRRPARVTADLRDEPIADVAKQVVEAGADAGGQEVKLAKAEMAEKAKEVGIGAGMVGGAGYVAYLGEHRVHAVPDLRAGRGHADGRRGADRDGRARGRSPACWR